MVEDIQLLTYSSCTLPCLAGVYGCRDDDTTKLGQIQCFMLNKYRRHYHVSQTLLETTEIYIIHKLRERWGQLKLYWLSTWYFWSISPASGNGNLSNTENAVVQCMECIKNLLHSLISLLLYIHCDVTSTVGLCYRSNLLLEYSQSTLASTQASVRLWVKWVEFYVPLDT